LHSSAGQESFNPHFSSLVVHLISGRNSTGLSQGTVLMAEFRVRRPSSFDIRNQRVWQKFAFRGTYCLPLKVDGGTFLSDSNRYITDYSD